MNVYVPVEQWDLNGEQATKNKNDEPAKLTPSIAKMLAATPLDSGLEMNAETLKAEILLSLKADIAEVKKDRDEKHNSY